MEIKKLYDQVLSSLFKSDSSIKKKAQSQIIEIMEQMGIMELGYYDITRSNNILSYIANKFQGV